MPWLQRYWPNILPDGNGASLLPRTPHARVAIGFVHRSEYHTSSPWCNGVSRDVSRPIIVSACHWASWLTTLALSSTSVLHQALLRKRNASIKKCYKNAKINFTKAQGKIYGNACHKCTKAHIPVKPRPHYSRRKRRQIVAENTMVAGNGDHIVASVDEPARPHWRTDDYSPRSRLSM